MNILTKTTAKNFPQKKSTTSDFLQNEDLIYIVGHTTPDLDAIVSAHAYQVYRHSQGDLKYFAVRCDEPNEVTKWAYKRWGLEMPTLVENISGKKVVLVDHTDPEQRPIGWENAEIIEVLDHHKLKIEKDSLPQLTIRQYGSTSTLVAQKMINKGVKLDSKLAGLMLSALLDDTLALRSPITTEIDKQIADYLAEEAGLTDISALVKEQFSQKDVWDQMSAEKACTADSKNYEIGDKKVRLTQIETMDNSRFTDKIASYYNYLEGIRTAESIDVALVLITDLIRNDCLVVVSAGENEIKDIESIFDTKINKENTMHLPGVVSRKRQVVPPLVQKWSESN
jgi:manganese-dependent inorganic pyrophosphatase